MDTKLAHKALLTLLHQGHLLACYENAREAAQQSFKTPARAPSQAAVHSDPDAGLKKLAAKFWKEAHYMPVVAAPEQAPLLKFEAFRLWQSKVGDMLEVVIEKDAPNRKQFTAIHRKFTAIHLNEESPLRAVEEICALLSRAIDLNSLAPSPTSGGDGDQEKLAAEVKLALFKMTPWLARWLLVVPAAILGVAATVAIVGLVKFGGQEIDIGNMIERERQKVEKTSAAAVDHIKSQEADLEKAFDKRLNDEVSEVDKAKAAATENINAAASAAANSIADQRLSFEKQARTMSDGLAEVLANTKGKAKDTEEALDGRLRQKVGEVDEAAKVASSKIEAAASSATETLQSKTKPVEALVALTSSEVETAKRRINDFAATLETQSANASLYIGTQKGLLQSAAQVAAKEIDEERKNGVKQIKAGTAATVTKMDKEIAAAVADEMPKLRPVVAQRINAFLGKAVFWPVTPWLILVNTLLTVGWVSVLIWRKLSKRHHANSAGTL